VFGRCLHPCGNKYKRHRGASRHGGRAVPREVTRHHVGAASLWVLPPCSIFCAKRQRDADVDFMSQTRPYAKAQPVTVSVLATGAVQSEVLCVEHTAGGGGCFSPSGQARHENPKGVCADWVVLPLGTDPGVSESWDSVAR
jgi:hypothetical protein